MLLCRNGLRLQPSITAVESGPIRRRLYQESGDRQPAGIDRSRTASYLLTARHPLPGGGPPSCQGMFDYYTL